MPRKDARALRDEVASAIDRGKFKRAIECILELEHLEPRDASWPKRAAEVYRRLGKSREAISAYERASERYAQAGFLIQAIAVCKQILRLDPQHTETLRRLSAMTEERTGATGVRAIGARDAVPELIITRNTGPIPRVDPATLMPADRTMDMLEMPERRSRQSEVVLPEFSLGEADEPPQLATGTGSVGAIPTFRPSTPPPIPPSPIGKPKPPPVPPPLPPPARQNRVTPTGQSRLRRNSPPPISGPRRRADSSVPIPLEPGAPLDALPLSSVLPGAEIERRDDGLSSGIVVIPLDDLDDLTGPLDVETLEPSIEDSIDVPYEDFDTPLPMDLEELRLDANAPLSPGDEELGASRSLSHAAQRALSQTPLLSGLLPEELEVLVEKLALVQLEAGQILFREGDDGDSLYIVSEGEVAVISEGPPRTELSRLLSGSFFGEIALITEQPRSATIAAVRRTELLAIDRDVVRDLVAEHPDTLRVILRFIKNRQVERVIQTSPLFAQFAEADRRSLADQFDFLEVEPGTRLITQDVRPDGLYVILAGRAEALRDLDGAVRNLGFLNSGEVFGEMALYGSSLSLVTVVARGKVLALRMPAAIFREVIMTHPQVLAYVGDLAEERRKQLEAPEDSGDVVDLKLDLL
jgi:CRP-like cAMP-binding protein